MDWSQLVQILLSILTFIFGMGAGWMAGSKLNQARAYNMFVKPITKKTKMVAWLGGNGYELLDFVTNKPLGSEPIVIKENKQTITKLPLQSFDKSMKTVTVGLFDRRDVMQVPLEANAVQVKSAFIGKDNEILHLDYQPNDKLERGLVSSDGVQNIIINVIQWAKGQAKGEITEDFKSMKKLSYIGLFLSIVLIIIGLLNWKYGGDALNLLGALKASNATAVLTYPPV